MINLLPPFARKQITHEYWVRVMAVGFFAWAVASVMVTIMLVPVYGMLADEKGVLSQKVGDAASIQGLITEANQTFVRANRYAAVLAASTEQYTPTFFTTELERIADTTIQIEDIVLVYQDRKPRPITLTAISATRQDLIAFLEAVQRHQYFGVVEMPLSSLAQSEDIRFSVEIPVVIE